MEGSERALCWHIEDPPGSELAFVRLFPDRLLARGAVLAAGTPPYRLDYELLTGADFVTEALVVGASGSGWSRSLDLRRDPAGVWSYETGAEGRVDLAPPGGDVSALAGALDCDLGRSPLTNTMPVLRHRLHEREGSVDFLMVWVSVPDLSLHPLRQRYTSLRPGPSGRAVVRAWARASPRTSNWTTMASSSPTRAWGLAWFRPGGARLGAP